MLAKETIAIAAGSVDTTAATKQTEKRNKEVQFKNCALFTDCTSKMIMSR